MSGGQSAVRDVLLLNTRPAGTKDTLAQSVAPAVARHLKSLDCPLMRIVALDVKVAVAPDEVAIFTSANAVRFAPPAKNRAAFCVGARTTAAAQTAGWQAEELGLDAEQLIDALLQRKESRALHHLSGVHHRGQVVETLRAAGLTARRSALYDQALLPLPDTLQNVLVRQETVIAPLFSPRAAGHFAQNASDLQAVHVVALSAAVAAPFAGLQVANLAIATQPTAQHMAEAIENLVLELGAG